MSSNLLFILSRVITALLWLPFLDVLVDAGAVRSSVRSPIYKSTGNLSSPDMRAVLTDPARQWHTDTILSFENSAQFANATERWTIFNPPTYKAAITPGSVDDVTKIVKIATSLNVPFLVTGGRHGYGITLGNLKNGLAIDLSALKSINLDKSAQTITIGPGITTGDILDIIYDAGFELQTGSASCPSLIGVTLGGGVGRYTGVHGLVIDALVSVQMITAKGKLITVSKDSNPELFWGIRGAGANFGVFVSATYKLHPLRNNGKLLSADMFFSAAQSSDYFKLVESLNNRLPAEMASVTLIMWDGTKNETVVGANWVYLGSEEDGRKALAPFLALKPVTSNIAVATNNRLIATAGGPIAQYICTPKIIRDLYSLNMKNYSASTYHSSFKKFDAFFRKYPDGRTSILQLEFFPNQAMASKPSGETAWPWRDATGYLNPEMLWSDEATKPAAQKLGRELREDLRATSGYPGGTVFVNYARGDETLEQIYSKKNLPRLAALKKKWDPKHFFSYNSGLPTKYSG